MALDFERMEFKVLNKEHTSPKLLTFAYSVFVLFMLLLLFYNETGYKVCFVFVLKNKSSESFMGVGYKNKKRNKVVTI